MLNEQIKLTQSAGWILDENNDYNQIFMFEWFEDEPDVYSMNISISTVWPSNGWVNPIYVSRDSTSYVTKVDGNIVHPIVNQNYSNRRAEDFTSFGIGYDSSKLTSGQVNISAVNCNLYEFCEVYFADMEIIRRCNQFTISLVRTNSMYGDKTVFLNTLADNLASLVDWKPYMEDGETFSFTLYQHQEELSDVDLSNFRTRFRNSVTGHHNQQIYLNGFGFSNDDIRTFLPVGETN